MLYKIFLLKSTSGDIDQCSNSKEERKNKYQRQSKHGSLKVKVRQDVMEECASFADWSHHTINLENGKPHRHLGD